MNPKFARNLLSLIFALPAFFSVIFSQNPDLIRYSEVLKTGNIEQKREALYQLRNLSSEEASRIAAISLGDASEIVRATATHSILYLPGDESVTLLLPLLKEKFAFVRKETAYALGKARNKRATESLLGILKKDKDLEVRGAAAFALGLIGDALAIEALAAALKNKNVFVQRSAARSLGEIGDPRALPALNAKLLDKKPDDDVRREILWAISEIADKNKPINTQ